MLPLDFEAAYDWRLEPPEYLLGLLLIAVLLAAGLGLGVALRRLLLPGWVGPPAHLAVVVLAVSGMVLVAEALGLIGAFTRLLYPVVLTGTAIGVGIAAARRAEAGAGVEVLRPTPKRVASLLAGLVAAVVVIRFAWTTGQVYGTGMTGFDTHWYHGPFTALFAQTGDTFALNNSIAPQYLSWFYPQNSELWHAIWVLPFERDLLSPVLNLLWLLGAMLACWCLGRPFGAAPLSLIGGSVILGSGLLFDQAGEMRNDLPAVFFVLAAAALATNAWGISGRAARAREGGPVAMRHPPLDKGALVTIGLAAGLAAGTKLNYLATAGALVVALAVILPRGRRARSFGLLCGAAFLTGGYWYVRNLIHSGNPLPWITSIGPIDLPGPAQEIGGREPHGVIEYLLDPGIWSAWFLPGFREALTLLWPVVLIGVVLTVILLVRQPRLGADANREGSEGILPTPLSRALAAVIVATGVAWLIAPASAEGPAGEPVGFVSGLRYLAPALALALALLPPGVLRHRPNQHGSTAGADRDRSPALGRHRDRLVPALAGGLVVMLAIGLYPLQNHYLQHRYADLDLPVPGLNSLFANLPKAGPAEPDAAPIATATTRLYPLFFPDLKRQVRFVGLPEPDGGFRRPEGCREWREAVNLTGARDLILARDRLVAGEPPLPPAAAWIASDPAARRLSVKGGAALFRLSGPLDPAGCP